MTNPSSMLKKGFGLDVLQIVERFKHGRVGEAFEKVVMTDEVQIYFNNQLIGWAADEEKEMTPLAQKEFRDMTTPSILWQNFSANFAINAFVNSMKKWLRSEDAVFDELVIEFATVENAKRVIDALQISFKEVAREVQARNIDSDWVYKSPFGGKKGKKNPEFFS